MVDFSIPGEPVAFARAGSNGTRRYTPSMQASYMEIVAIIANAAMVGTPIFKGAVRLQIRVETKAPKSWSLAERAAAKWRTSAPDADNILKLLADAMQKVVYRNDAQIAHAEIQKIYGLKDCVSVSVTELEP